MAVARHAEMTSDIDAGEPGADFTRRLSDKILNAFNHAYAVGETDIARHLRRILVRNERGHNGDRARQDGCDAVARADLWVAFVEARNEYRAVSARKRASEKQIDQALQNMKDAYRRWSDG